MAKFQVVEIFRLPTRAQFVIAGRVTVGEVRAGMNALVDRVAIEESLVGLVCNEKEAEDAELCHGLCEIGTEIEVTDGPVT